MASREYYEKVGLQDEKLFMYFDEIDTAIRTKKNGYKIAVLSNVYVWHWHINQFGWGIENQHLIILFPGIGYMLQRSVTDPFILP